mgnify:CR=1 FL=1
MDKVCTKNTNKLHDCGNNVDYMGCQDKAWEYQSQRISKESYSIINFIIKCIKIIHYLKVK